jgi:CRISPR-associated protein Cas5 subtype I-A
MKPRAVIAVYRVHWGLSVRSMLGSAVPQAHSIPPPTTLVGALAEGAVKAGVIRAPEFYAESLDNGPQILVSGAFKAVRVLGVYWSAAGWLTPAAKSTVTIRYFSGPYRSRLGEVTQDFAAGRKPVSQLFGPLGVEYVISPRGMLQVIYATTEEKRLRDVAVAAAHVSRIGSKESIVDPLWVGVCELESLRKPVATTIAAPLDYLSRPPEGSFTVEPMPWPRNYDEWVCWYSAQPGACARLKQGRLGALREVVVPVAPGGARLAPSRRVEAFRVKPEACYEILSHENTPPLKPFLAPKSLWGA